MAIRLDIILPQDMGLATAVQRVFDQDQVTIGRASSNDVELQDLQRVVSSRHAEVRRKGHACVLVDMGSTNGTRVNGKVLLPQREYELQDGDKIVIGEFTITFSLQPQQAYLRVHGKPGEVCTAVRSGDADAIVYELCRRYADMQDRKPQEREVALLSLLRQVVGPQDDQARTSLIEQVRKGLCRRLGQQEGATGSPSLQPPHERVAPPDLTAEAEAYRRLVDIAQKYCRRLPSRLSPEFIEQFVLRISHILQITFGNLVESLEGRRQFARELDVEATRVLSWRPNQLKQSESEQQVGAYLLDVISNPQEAEVVMADLQRVFRDLALHHLGVIKGFEESLRAILREFDPATLEAEMRISPVRIGPFRLPASFRLIRRWGAWKEFTRKHRRFTEEEVRIFEQLLAPHFSKGYLDVQKTHPRL